MMSNYEINEIIIDQRKSGKPIDTELLTALIEESLPRVTKELLNKGIVFFQFKVLSLKEKQTDTELLTFQELVSKLVERGAHCGCGYIFKPTDFAHYPHDYGVALKDHTRKQWVYAHCPRCHYDMALWKIEQSLEVEQ